MPNSKDEVKKTYLLVEGYILSLDKLSVNVDYTMSFSDLIDEIKFLKEKDKKVFVSLNKNMHNDDIPFLKDVLIKLNDLRIDGVFYYDAAVVNIKKEEMLDLKLVWNQEHMTTNYLSSDFWYENGAEYTCLSYELTKEEMEEITEKTKSKIIVPVFGYQPIFTSKRKLLSYYKEIFNVNSHSDDNFIFKEQREYPIIEKEHFFAIFTSKIFNGLKHLENLNADFFVFNSVFLSIDEIYELLSSINKLNVNEASEEINDLYNTDTGFLYRKTVYKVKKDEK